MTLAISFWWRLIYFIE